MNVSRLIVTLERLKRLQAAEREAAARRDLAADPDLLDEVRRLLPHLDAPDGFLAPPLVPGAGTADMHGQEVRTGRVFADRWRIDGTIAHGAQGVVCDATDLVSGRQAAVKVMRGLSVPEAARVRREAATLRWLNLPGVVRFIDFGQDGPDAWLAMERIHGRPFPGRATPCSWGQVADTTRALLDALGRVHAAGVVHADLKPANVLVDEQGIVTIVDLGLSTARTEASYADGTTTGGTRGYVAPEVAACGAPTPQSDLYAIGAILFRSLSGQLPGRCPERASGNYRSIASLRRGRIE